MPTINEGDCCGCGTPSGCDATAIWAVLAQHPLSGTPAIINWGSYSWPSGGDTALFVQNTWAPYGGSTGFPFNEDNRAATRYLQVDDTMSGTASGGTPETTFSASWSRTRKYDVDTGQLWYLHIALTREDGSSDSGTWSMDTTTGNVTITGTDPNTLTVPDGPWFSVNALNGRANPSNDSMTISVGPTSIVYDYAHAANDGSGGYDNNHREITLSSSKALTALLTDTISMLTTIDLTNLAATYTFDDTTTHTINAYTQLYWVNAVPSVSGKFIAIHDPGNGYQRAEKSVGFFVQAAKARYTICADTNLYSQELTAPVPNSAAPGAPDNGSAQTLSGADDCNIGWAAGTPPITKYVSPGDIPFTWGYATPGGC